jgi:hypothetical protein
MKATEIDAVALVRHIRDAQYEQIKDKSTAEQIRYFREKAAILTAQLLEKPAGKIGRDPKSN